MRQIASHRASSSARCPRAQHARNGLWVSLWALIALAAQFSYRGAFGLVLVGVGRACVQSNLSRSSPLVIKRQRVCPSLEQHLHRERRILRESLESCLVKGCRPIGSLASVGVCAVFVNEVANDVRVPT